MICFSALQEEEDHAGARQERQAGAQPDRGDGLRDEQVRGQALYHHRDSIIIITSSDLAAQVEATAVDWRLLITTMVMTYSDFPEPLD